MKKEIIKSVENNIDGLYENLTYKELNWRIEKTFRNMAENFIELGFWLKQVRKDEKFKEDGYKDIWEYAKDKYGISRSKCSRYMDINDKFSENGNSPTLAEEYRNYGKSQLQEMLYLEGRRLDMVTPGMTVSDIRELRKLEGHTDCEKACDIAQMEPEQKEEPQDESLKPYQRGCITGWSRYPDCCSCCGHGGAECCSQCDESCNSRCGWVAEPYIPEEDIPGQMHVEDYPELLPGSESCAASHIEGSETVEEAHEKEGNTSRCLYREGFSCSLSEEAKKMPGDGSGCSEKCCWECTKRGCKLECYSSSSREEETEQEKDEPVADVEYQEVDNISTAGTGSVTETQQGKKKHEELCGLSDLELLQEKLEKEKKKLVLMQEEFTDKDRRVRLQKLVVGALAAYICDLDKILNPLQEPVQPELPVLKNNEQRKAWLCSYKDWGLWYEDENIGCKYYKYDFKNGARLIAEVYLVPKTRYCDEYEVRYLHLVGGPEPPKDKTGCYGKWQRHEKYSRYPSNETELVEFLKYVQREK